MKDKALNINISTLTILKLILIFTIIYFLYLVKDILVVLFISLVLASALDPWVDWMQGKKIPRALGMVFIYLVLFFTISLVVYLIIPPIIQQINDLSSNSGQYTDKLLNSFSVFKEYANKQGFLNDIKGGLGTLNSNLEKAASGVFSTIPNVFGGILSFFLVLVITFYMVVEENAMRKIIWSVAPSKYQPYIIQLANRMQKKIGLWLRGQLILSLIIFLLTFLSLSILRVEYALTLALVAGLAEFIPYLGPIIAAVPAVFLTLAQSPILALVVLVLYLVIQFVENNIIVPKLMQKVVGLNPIVIIVVLLVGFKLAGTIGAILSIPVATAANVFVNDFFDKKLEENNN